MISPNKRCRIPFLIRRAIYWNVTPETSIYWNDKFLVRRLVLARMTNDLILYECAINFHVLIYFLIIIVPAISQ